MAGMTRAARIAVAALVGLLAVGAGPESPPPNPGAEPGWGTAPEPEPGDAGEVAALWTKAHAALDKEQWRLARVLLTRISNAEPENADAFNLLGYTSRKLGEYPKAFAFYARALEIDPSHRQALEYLGEAHLQVGQRVEALAVLERLRALCPDGCRERDLLEAAYAPPATPAE